jgi:hypothetical protein
LRLPQREQQIERIGQAVMQRVGAAGDPKHPRSTGSGMVSTAGCGRKSGNCHNAMPCRRELLRARVIRSQQMHLSVCDALMTNDLF